MNDVTVTEAQVDEIFASSDLVEAVYDDKFLSIVCRLPCGFIFVVGSGCVDPANFSIDIGRDILHKRIKDKIWELEGYTLQKMVADINYEAQS